MDLNCILRGKSISSLFPFRCLLLQSSQSDNLCNSSFHGREKTLFIEHRFSLSLFALMFCAIALALLSLITVKLLGLLRRKIDDRTRDCVIIVSCFNSMNMKMNSLAICEACFAPMMSGEADEHLLIIEMEEISS
jgi:hypothetical protein